MNDTFWLNPIYKKELLKDAKFLIKKGQRRGLSFLKDYYTNRLGNRHITKHETIYQIFKNINLTTILEIGSYDGYDALVMSRNFPEAQVYTFEADKDNLFRVKENIYFRNYIKLVNKAVSDSNELVDFYSSYGKNNVNDYRGSGSILKSTKEHAKIWKGLSFNEAYKVEGIRIDDFAGQENFTKIDVAWMDVQGAELLVLKGFGELLKKTKLIMLEFWEDDSFYENCVTLNELETFFIKNNFSLQHLWRDGCSGDAIFINNNFEKI